MLEAASNEKVFQEEENIKQYKERYYDKKQKIWKEKAFHKEFNQKTEEIETDESRRWLRNLFLKKETEGMMLVAQKQVLRTNFIKCSIDKTSDTSLSWLCGINTETIRHITSRSSKVVQTKYRKRHLKVVHTVHWEMSKKYELENSSKWYED